MCNPKLLMQKNNLKPCKKATQKIKLAENQTLTL